jgi:hypothetical protein
MELRERQHDENAAQNATGPGAVAPGGQLNELRAGGNDALRAGDEAIDRVLSNDSALYNRSTEQTGGQ